ncbi:YopT-type cysteine protease domain-containing protein [Legionella beliardensis]|uniref:YopT-type cysteine protease domain-containing protein n=1 Tax=Legionella beliardensis TaxID=91822 RepID=UPI0013580955|nr:YopT-type cysteine protease domain-containing protein [Legionella beliardensis]
MIEVLDPTWYGACNALASEWMLNKICSDDIQTPTIHKITDSSVPYFVAFGDNRTADKEVRSILSKHYQTADISQAAIDGGNYSSEPNEHTFAANIDNLLNYMARHKCHYGLICSGVCIFDQNKGDLPDNFGHAVSFAKRGIEIAWFDPNYGEITFSNFNDFRIWFKREAQEGVLGFIFNNFQSQRKYQNLAEVFPQPQFTTAQQENHSPFVKQIIKRRTNAEMTRSNVKKFILTDYTVQSFHSETHIKLAKPVENITKETQAKAQIDLIKRSMLIKKGIFGVKSSSANLRNQLLWDLIRKAENNEIKYTDALKKIDMITKLKIDKDTYVPKHNGPVFEIKY